MSAALERLAVVALIVAGLACSTRAAQGQAASPAAAQAQEQTIEHLVPRADFVGPAPVRFEWTPAKGADSYVIGIWNDVNILMWSKAGISEPMVDKPANPRLEPGTYFWNVVALRGGQQIGDSGMAAFVVKE